ncbi:MAG: YdeI/OmpD-associated family protein [Dehalogenimonas sp.]
MVSQVGLLMFKDAGEWHAWLADNHDKAKDAWVVHYKKNSKTPGLRYDEALEQAIAFGWIDGKLKSIDSEKFMLRYTPRRANSVWSLRNRKLAESLIASGKMDPSGQASVKNAKTNGNWDIAYSDSQPIMIPEDLQIALDSEKIASENFQRYSVSSQNMYIRWVESAKTFITRHNRIMSVVEKSRQNLKLA